MLIEHNWNLLIISYFAMKNIVVTYVHDKWQSRLYLNHWFGFVNIGPIVEYILELQKVKNT